ncbi:MAG: hypothetical protein ACLFR0_04630 [Alphaproteobacteria bacterium]
MFNKNKNLKIADLTLTALDGKRRLVNAFDIAMVAETSTGSTLTLKVPVAGEKWVSKDGLQVEVSETFDQISEMRAKLGL